MNNPAKTALAEALALKADTEMLRIGATQDTAQVCEAIGTLPLLTVSDAANIVRALALRSAGTPLQMPRRSELCNLLATAERDLLNLWTTT